MKYTLLLSYCITSDVFISFRRTHIYIAVIKKEENEKYTPARSTLYGNNYSEKGNEV
jgi:hypothetical protein